MWGRDISDHKNGFTICRRQAGPDVPHAGWVPGCEAGWPVSTPLTSGQNITSRRFSAASDSGDTGIGTSSSDSIEEHSSGISSFKPIRSHIAIPTAHVMPSTSNPSLTRPGKQDRSTCSKGNLSQTLPGKPKNIFILNPSLDMKDPRPIRKWSSLSKLSGPGNESPDGDVSGNGNFVSSMVTVSNCNAKLCTYGGNVTENCIHPNTEYLKSQDTKSWNTSTKESTQNQYPLSDGQYKFECLYNAAGDSSLSESTSSKKPSDLAFSAFSATKATKDARETCGPRHGFTSLEHQPAFGTTAPTSLRTQLWLSDQMLASTLGLRPAERSCAITGCQLKQRQQQPWQEADQMQMHNKPPLQVSMVFPTQLDQDPSQKDAQLQIKESLLRKKDIIIESQEQQIFQLQRKIQENELRAQRAFLEQCEPTLMLKTQHQPSCENIRHTRFTEISKVLDWGKKDLLQRLSAAELEILHLKETLKKNTQKYMDETKKIEEKVHGLALIVCMCSIIRFDWIV